MAAFPSLTKSSTYIVHIILIDISSFPSFPNSGYGTCILTWMLFLIFILTHHGI